MAYTSMLGETSLNLTPEERAKANEAAKAKEEQATQMRDQEIKRMSEEKTNIPQAVPAPSYVPAPAQGPGLLSNAPQERSLLSQPQPAQQQQQYNVPPEAPLAKPLQSYLQATEQNYNFEQNFGFDYNVFQDTAKNFAEKYNLPEDQAQQHLFEAFQQPNEEPPKYFQEQILSRFQQTDPNQYR